MNPFLKSVNKHQNCIPSYHDGDSSVPDHMVACCTLYQIGVLFKDRSLHFMQRNNSAMQQSNNAMQWNNSAMLSYLK